MIKFSPHQFKKLYLDQKIFVKPEVELKIGYININGLYSAESCSILNNDFNLLHMDILLIADTRLSRSDDDTQLENNLSNWRVALRSDSEDTMKHMGMLLLVSKHSKINLDCLEMNSKQGFKNVDRKEIVYVQVIRIKVARMKVGFVYIRETPNTAELDKLIEAFRQSDCFMGDLNLDPAREDDRKKLQKLCGPERVRILQEFTTSRSNQLDHIILKSHLSPKVFATSFINLSSDHRTISIRIPLDGNDYSSSFKSEWFFDREKFTRRHNIKELHQLVESTKFGLHHIDLYLDILKEVRSDTVIFNLYVMDELIQNDFEDLDPSLKSIHIIKAKFVIIPIKMRNISCIAILTVGEEIELHFTQRPPVEDLKKILFIIVRDYMADLYQSLKLKVPDFKNRIKTTENKVKPANQDQQWVYLLTFLKGKLFNQNPKHDEFDFEKHEKVMVAELKAKKAIQMTKQMHASRITKRKLEGQNVKNSLPKKPKIIRRYFSNPDQESCWMNSCLQVVTTAMDHLNPQVKSGSPLYTYLMYLQDSKREMPLDPTEIKNLIYLQERRRIIEKNVLPIYRLFHFEGTTSSNEADLCLELLERHGQQDCKDFFSCLILNKQAWPDVFSLFQFSVEEFTICSSCGFSSRSGHIEDVTLLRLDCPVYATPLHEIIEKLNGQTVQQDWKCESVCKKVTGGRHFTKVVDVSTMTFLTTIVNRLIRLGNGSLEILDTKCRVTDDVIITDSFDQSAVFSPIAVIHHTGIVTQGNDTRGHYRADVRDPATGEWFQTSDDQLPFQVPSPSEQCYITIYKKIVKKGTRSIIIQLTSLTKMFSD